MAINLLTKYHDQLEQRYNVKNFLTGKTSKDFKFIDANTIKILTYTSQTLGNYTQSPEDGVSRFGAFNEAQDTVQTMTLTRDVCYNVAVDKVNYVQGGKLKTAEKIVKTQNDEQVVPTAIKNTLADWTAHTGIGSATGTLSVANIVAALTDARVAMTNASVPETDRYCVIGATNYAKLADTKNMDYLEALNKDVFENGVVAKCKSFKMIEVPDDILPTNVNFICWQKNSVIDPHQIATCRVIDDSENIDGILCQGRYVYNGFVIDVRKAGVYKHTTA